LAGAYKKDGGEIFIEGEKFPRLVYAGKKIKITGGNASEAGDAH
jgi:hypothetical protein